MNTKLVNLFCFAPEEGGIGPHYTPEEGGIGPHYTPDSSGPGPR